MSYELETAIELKTTKQLDDIFGNPPVVNIKVVGVGGAGCNSINRMIEDGVNLEGVEFIAINTDKNALSVNRAAQKLCIGQKTTKGWGAGTDPNIGQKAAEESADEIRTAIEGADMLFLTAGMGGGTGTGAAPVVASIAKELGILTVAIVTKPFEFEGVHKMLNAEIGLENLAQFVDAYVVVPNQKLVERLSTKTSMKDAFKIADEVLRKGVIGLAEVIVHPMMINVDYADIRTVLKDAGMAHMGVGVAKGENRVLDAIKQAVASPLIETSISGATGLIICIKSGESLGMSEVSNYIMLVRNLVHERCNIKYGVEINAKYGDEVEVLIIASGFANDQEQVKNNVNNWDAGNIEKPQEPTPEAPKKNVPKFFANFSNFKKTK